MNKHFLLHVREVIPLTPEAVEIRMEHPRSERIHYKPGQFLTVVAHLNGEAHRRSYSLASAPKLDDYLSIGVKAMPEGLVSAYLNHQLRRGDELEVIEPMGRFYLENSVKFHRLVVLLGGGSGITPLMSVARSVLFNEPKSHVALLYANRDEQSVMFGPSLEKLRKMFPQRFFLTHCFSRPQQPLEAPHLQGRLTADRIAHYVQQLPLPSLPRTYLLCGPDGLMLHAHAALRRLEVDPASILQEKFSAPPVRDAYQGDGKIRSVHLQFRGKYHQLSVPAGTTVLEAGLSQGIPMPYSCQRGVCAACMGQLEEGSVHMDVDEGLLPFEQAKGKILCCQARPTSDDVKIII